MHFGNAPIAEVLDIRGFNLNAILELDPEFLKNIDHEHHDEVESFVFRSEKPLMVRSSKASPVRNDPGLRTRSPALQGHPVDEG